MARQVRHRVDVAASISAPAGADDDWRPLQPQTLVDLVIDALISQAARGAVLPGDRIVEAELARKLGISRVPVREALRLLESQGIVVNEPYKGIRLRPVTNRRVHDLIEARTALETSAAHRAVAAGHNRDGWIAPLRAAVDEMDLMAARKDAYGIAAADTNFHRALCRLGGNSVVLDLWETLSRQSTIIFGLATLGKPMPAIVDEHRELLVSSFSMSGTLAPRCKEMQADESKVKKMPTGMCRWAKVAKRERA